MNKSFEVKLDPEINASFALIICFFMIKRDISLKVNTLSPSVSGYIQVITGVIRS